MTALGRFLRDAGLDDTADEHSPDVYAHLMSAAIWQRVAEKRRWPQTHRFRPGWHFMWDQFFDDIRDGGSVEVALSDVEIAADIF